MERLMLRGCTTLKDIPEQENRRERVVEDMPDRQIFFDFETTNDDYLNPTFGSFSVVDKKEHQYGGLIFVKKNLTRKELIKLKRFSRKKNIRLFTLDEFNKILYWEVCENKTTAVGFNLKFDASRLGFNYGYGRRAARNGFSFTLFKDKWYPRLRIYPFADAFKIEYVPTSIKFRKKDFFKGHFLDIQKPACVLSDNKTISLEEACKLFDTPLKKMVAEQHGKIDNKYIRYNLRDTEVTKQLYFKIVEEFQKYGLKIPLTEVYSAASLAKQALKQCGVTNFFECNPNFSKELIGNILSGYYGARVECKIRKVPTKVTVLDFFSMYPTISILLNTWAFITAKKIKHKICTMETRKFVNEFDVKKALNKNSWQKFSVLVKVAPDEDIFPARTKYNGEDLNIGVNYVTYDGELYYFLPDVLMSKIITGKTPKILSALKFYPVGKQDTLKTTKICGIKIDPRTDNLIKELVEKRYRIKKGMKRLKKSSQKYSFLSAQEKALKILVNALSYGIFLELNTQDGAQEITVYSNKTFDTKGKYEEPGKYFHPVVGAMITSSARFLLAIAEKFIADRGGVHSYMDTDAIFTPPLLADELSHLFDSLNPYSFSEPILKKEEGMEDIWFYGISSKRYCLFHKKGNKIIIPEGKKLFYKLHGLGYVLCPFNLSKKKRKTWHKQFWLDILNAHYHPEMMNEISDDYSELAVISSISVTKANTHRCLKNLNEGKPLEKQLKPFNFMHLGYSTVDNIKPVAPARDNPQESKEAPFVDYYTGKEYEGPHYWKMMDDLFDDYINHPEAKFEGDTGVMKRRHLKPIGCAYIGKETRRYDEDYILQSDIEQYLDEEEFCKYVLKITPEESRKAGVTNKGTRLNIQKRVRESKKLNVNDKAVRRYVKYFIDRGKND